MRLLINMLLVLFVDAMLEATEYNIAACLHLFRADCFVYRLVYIVGTYLTIIWTRKL